MAHRDRHSRLQQPSPVLAARWNCSTGGACATFPHAVPQHCHADPRGLPDSVQAGGQEWLLLFPAQYIQDMWNNLENQQASLLMAVAAVM